jgi:cytoskeletal protein RodZ
MYPELDELFSTSAIIFYIIVFILGLWKFIEICIWFFSHLSWN